MRLRYRAAEPCPTEEEFLRALAHRAPGIRVERDAALVLRIDLKSDGPGFDGTMVLSDRTEPKKAALVRDVPARTCEEAAAALALVSALAIDAMPRPSPFSAPAVVSEAPKGPGARVRTPRGLSPPSRSSPLARLHFATIAGSELRFGATPNPLFVAPVGIEVEAPFAPRLGPAALRLSFARGATHGVRTGKGSAAFEWTVGIFELCPVRVRLASHAEAPRFEGLVCLRTELGVLRGEGREIVPARNADRLWFALGAGARLRYHPARPLFVEVAVGVGTPVARPRYVFDPSVTVFEPSVGGWASAALGVRFW